MNINNYFQKSRSYALTSTLGLSLLVGCTDIRDEVSPILHEDAVVVDTVYTPSIHDSNLAPTITGFTSNDGPHLGFAITSVDVPEKYGVVFKCQHGKFISQGADKRHKDLWNRLNEGDAVDITYKEFYKTTYEDSDGNGEKEVIERRLIGYDFLDAQPKDVKNMKAEPN